MDNVDEVFYLTTIEQMRAIADALRLRLVELLAQEQLTVTQLGERVGESPAKVHYHVRELERIGIVRLVETRERGGILEKYYRAVAKSIQMAPDVLRTLPRGEMTEMLNEFFQLIFNEAIRAAYHHAEHPELDEPLTISANNVFATKEEFRALLKDIGRRVDELEAPRGIENEQEWALSVIAHAMRPHAPDGDESATPSPPTHTPAMPNPPHMAHAPAAPRAPGVPAGNQPRPIKSYVIGAHTISRKYLERILTEGRTLEFTVLGICRFDEDIPAELVNRVVSKFRHRGQLIASPEVREALSRKGGDA
jgi:DNA-binding transcriptional ArsR family regulator